MPVQFVDEPPQDYFKHPSINWDDMTDLGSTAENTSKMPDGSVKPCLSYLTTTGVLKEEIENSK